MEDAAMKNLEKVIKAVGAKKRDEFGLPASENYWCELHANGCTFFVGPSYVMKSNGARTCYFPVCKVSGSELSMPDSEKIANALLLLKNRPAVFDNWARQNGPSF